MTHGIELRDPPRIPVGDTGMEISRVGLGSWGLGEPLQAIRYGGEQPEDRTTATILEAVKVGINWIDTAPVYGLGTSEERIARALARLPEAERPFVFTKCGISMRPEDRGNWFGSAERIREDVESSLQRLHVERLDLVVMHQQPVDGTPVEVYWETLLGLRNEGKVREVGLSNHSAEMLDRASAISPVPLLQTAFSAVNRLDGADVLPWCHEHGTAVVLWGALHSGLLGGAFDEGGVGRLADDDWRRTDPEFTERLPANLLVVGALREVARRHGVSVAAAAIAWTLSWPGVTGAIAGARSPEHVEGLNDAAQLELDHGDLETVADAIRSSGAGQGPALPGESFDTALLTAPPRSLHTFHRAPRRGSDGPLR